MGFSMLGGIIQSILSGISGVIMAIVTPILRLILGFVNQFFIGPIISLIFNLISYGISLFFYGIACFTLALIDYVELMFRLLAGLDVDGVSLNLANSPDKGSDLVVQLIRTPEVRDIFLAMVVVGMFLLIITTIFQMIKVEYTTEGAKNAKGPILNKAFKGLCNMILLPALCVFGVILGNQVLDLLDKATKPDSDLFGQSATVSGTLFVAAAAEAHYQKGDFRVVFMSPTVSMATQELIINVVPILINSIFDAWGDAFNADDQKDYMFPDNVRKESESLVASGTISYWNIAAISQIYDYSRINYLLLIFGGCIVIKTLYYTCFGMIVRLYQCGMLFIISPAVIGMTPVNEGGLGKWRSEFVGQALSAYGVVLALNIFFVLVRVLLSIDFSFEGVTGYFFGAGMMEGLLKAIIVMGGTISIEKFSKELGGFFGAKDALGQGKEMEGAIKKAVQDVGNGIVKAIGTAVQVAMMATGVGGAAVGGLKAAGAAAKAAGGGMKGLAAGAKSIGSGLGNKAMDMGTNFAQTFVDASGADVDLVGRWQQTKHDRAQAHVADMAHQSGAARRDVTAAKADFETKDAAFQQADATYQRAIKQGVRDPEVMQRLKNKRDSAAAARDSAQTRLSAAQDRYSAAREVSASAKREADLVKFDAKDRAVQHESERILHSGVARQAGKSFFEEKTFLGKAVAGTRKQIGGYEKAAADEYGKYAKAAYEHIGKVRSDKKEEAHDARNYDAIGKKNVFQKAEIRKLAVDEITTQQARLGVQKNDMMDNLNSMLARYRDPNSGLDQEQRKALAGQIENYRVGMVKELGLDDGDIKLKGDGTAYEFAPGADAKIEVKQDVVLNIIDSIEGDVTDQKVIEEAVRKVMADYRAEHNGRELSPTEVKQIEKIFENIVQKINK